MGLADELRKDQPPMESLPGQEVFANPEPIAATPENTENKILEQNPTAAIAAVEAEIAATEVPMESKSQEEVFAEKVSELLLTDDLYSYVRLDKQKEFPAALHQFIIEKFWNDRLDEKLDQQKLGKLLLNFYEIYLDDINEFYAAQAAFKDSNRLLEFFKKQAE